MLIMLSLFGRKGRRLGPSPRSGGVERLLQYSGRRQHVADGDLQVSTGLKGTFLVCIQVPWQCGWVLKPHYTSLQRFRFGWLEKNPNL